jgi:hypothetical protein
MTSILTNPMIQYGALGLAFVVTLAGIRAFFMLMVQRHEQQQDLFTHHSERERVFAEQLVACVDRNSAALEKVEQGLQRIYIQLARTELASADSIFIDPH